jgi:GxxExxY protein
MPFEDEKQSSHEEEKRRSADKRGDFRDGSAEVIAALLEVHARLGPGLLESAYDACLARELAMRSIPYQRQVPLPVTYKGVLVDCSYRLDFVVNGGLVVELKSVERLMPIHSAQVITYLRLAGLPAGLLVNFNVRLLREGLRRLWPSTSPSSFFSSPLRVKPDQET